VIVNLRVVVNSQVGSVHHKQRSGQTHEGLPVNSVHHSSQTDNPNKLGQVNQLDQSNQTELFKPFKTKPYALALLSTGDGRAIASWRFFGMSGKLLWKLKDYIDRRFINRFSN
jgi:NADH dehydrogenase FAD-containing subunit